MRSLSKVFLQVKGPA
jgi:hypothetical protein